MFLQSERDCRVEDADTEVNVSETKVSIEDMFLLITMQTTQLVMIKGENKKYV